MTTLNEQLIEKWSPLLEAETLPEIKDPYRKAVTAALLENEEAALNEENPTNVAAGVAGWDPVLIGMVRRSTPQLIAFDVCGVQPMKMPTGLVFAMRARYENQSGTEALYNEADAGFAGSKTANGGTYDAVGTPTPSFYGAVGAHFLSVVGSNAGDSTFTVAAADRAYVKVGQNIVINGVATTVATYNSGTGVATTTLAAQTYPVASYVQVELGAGKGLTTAEGEGDIAQKMAMTIEKRSVTADSYQLTTGYSLEIQQDMKALHGLDAESELSHILSTELTTETNRRILRTIYNIAKAGSTKTALPGVYDGTVDSDGRWQAEKFKGMFFQIERDANAIHQDVRHGKGNILITSPDVASALAAAGVLDYAPALDGLASNNWDQTTFVGTIAKRMKVYVDPYAVGDFWVVGFKGTNPYQAGLFFAPYVAATMLRATDPKSFQPLIALKSRYGMVCNPFYTTGQNAMSAFRSNGYYRISQVRNLVDTAS